MTKRILLAAAVVGLAATAASAARSDDDGRYRLAAGSGGGNAQPHYRMVRVENTARATDAPYALTGRRTPDRWQTATNQGGNTRFQFIVPVWER